MKRLFASLVVAGLFVGLLAGPVAAAPGGVARNQVTTNTYTMPLGYGHTYNVVISPCNGGTVAASGWQWGSDGNPLTHNPNETITATLSADGTMLTFNPAVYVGGWDGAPFSWSGTFPIDGGTFTVTTTAGVDPGVVSVYPGVVMTLVSSSPTTYATHGAYVTANSGGDDAAHSCIGMPIVAQQ